MKTLLKSILNRYYKKKAIKRFVDPITVKYGKLKSHVNLTKEQEVKTFL